MTYHTPSWMKEGRMAGRRWIVLPIALGVLMLLAIVSVQAGPSKEVPAPDSHAAALGTSFTYQGKLVQSSTPVSDTCDFQFSLYDDASTGAQIGTTQSLGSVGVADGVFTVQLDFGSGAFQGDGRWLQIAVRCPAGSGGYTTLAPRQPLAPAPYALALPGLWTQQNTTSPNLIGGYRGNSVAPGIYGATISGGGLSGSINLVTADFGTIGGGAHNTASHWNATVGGGYGNTASGMGAFVGGGGFDGDLMLGNEASGNASTVGGGLGNTAGGTHSTIGGGAHNTASNWMSTVGGGAAISVTGQAATVAGGLLITATGDYAAVGGGRFNSVMADYGTIAGGGSAISAYGNRVTDEGGTVGGGADNQAGDGTGTTTDAYYATVGGGWDNTAGEKYATVSGGWGNTVSGHAAIAGGGFNNNASGNWSTIGGGSSISVTGQAATAAGGSRVIVTGDYATAGGGRYNTVEAPYGTIAGGGYTSEAYGNRVTDEGGAIGGGGNNQAGDDAGTTTDAYYATVGGGWGNTASKKYATVPGGEGNTAAGDHSFAAGHRAQANNTGCFVWGDSTNADVTCNNDDRWVARASGGVYFYSSSDLGHGVYLAAGADDWSSVWTSDRNQKVNFTPVDGEDILARLAQVPITTWSYAAGDPSVRHIGPVSQDFYAAFGLGEDDGHISAVDANGVALAAIQGLHAQNVSLQAKSVALEAEVSTLQAENAALQAQLANMETRLVALEQGSAPLQARINLPFGDWLGLTGLLVGLGIIVSVSKSKTEETSKCILTETR